MPLTIPIIRKKRHLKSTCDQQLQIIKHGPRACVFVGFRNVMIDNKNVGPPSGSVSSYEHVLAIWKMFGCQHSIPFLKELSGICDLIRFSTAVRISTVADSFVVDDSRKRLIDRAIAVRSQRECQIGIVVVSRYIALVETSDCLPDRLR